MPVKTPFRSPNFHAKRSSPQTAGDLNRSNYTIMNTFMLHARRIWLFAVCPEMLNALCIVNSTFTMIQSKTGTHFRIFNTLETSQPCSLNHHYHICRWRKLTVVQVLRWAIRLVSHGNVMLSVALKRTYKTIPTTILRHVKSTNISSVGWRSTRWRRTTTMYWRKKSPLCVSQPSKTGMVSSSSWLACKMIRLTGSGNRTLSRIWNRMTITNTLSNTIVETLSKTWDGWCGSQPTLSILFMPLSVSLTAIRHEKACIRKCAPQTAGGRKRQGVIPEDDDVLTDIKSTLIVGDALILLILMSNGTHLEFCWWQDRVTSIYHNWQSIFEEPAETHNPQRHNGGSPADSDQELQYISEAARWAVANKLRGAERYTPVRTPALHL